MVLNSFRAQFAGRGATMDAFAAGAATAARSLGYRGLADIIVEEHLGPERIARLFALSAGKASAQDLAVILSAGAIARFKLSPGGWSGEIESRLAQEASAAHGRHLDFERLSGRAAALVKKRWAEIAQLAAST
jgi:hypothetical protein